MSSEHQLFFIIGPSRIGKSIAVDSIREHENPIVIHTDAVRSGVRQALVGPYPKRINSVTIQVKANLHPEGEELLPIRENRGEDAFGWDGVMGMIGFYHAVNKFDVLVEGVAVTLERVSELKKFLPSFRTRAIFIGYSKESVADEIIEYSNKHHDHLWVEMQNSGKGENYIREMVRNQIPINEKNKALIGRYGEDFKYFDRSERSFEEHIKSITDYYLAR